MSFNYEWGDIFGQIFSIIHCKLPKAGAKIGGNIGLTCCPNFGDHYNLFLAVYSVQGVAFKISSTIASIKQESCNHTIVLTMRLVL